MLDMLFLSSRPIESTAQRNPESITWYEYFIAKTNTHTRAHTQKTCLQIGWQTKIGMKLRPQQLQLSLQVMDEKAQFSIAIGYQKITFLSGCDTVQLYL